MPSSVISHFHYHPQRRELVVHFTTGRRYAYAGVPEEEVAAFKAAFSKGSFFNRHIRDRYRYRELAGEGGN